MAFTDQNGKITIDEIAAQQDIKNMAAAKENLTAAADSLKEAMALASELSGDTAATIEDTARQFIKQIDATITSIDTASHNIETTVRTYQAMDSKLKNVIMGVSDSANMKE